MTHLGRVPSTQDLARDRFEGEPELVTAGEQTAGRGRAGSTWQSAPRAIAMSLAFRPGWPGSRLSILPLLAGLAATDVMAGVSLKWPNDVLVADGKVAGILAESFDGLVVVGMGVNLWWPDAPPGVAGLRADDPGETFGRDLAEGWATRLLTLVEQGPDHWPIDRYRAVCSTVGTRITWEPDGSGTAVDVSRDGGLIVDTGSGRTTLTSAGIRHVRTDPNP